MIKINGAQMITRDEVGETPIRMRADLIRAACDRFLIAQGVATEDPRRFNPHPGQRRRGRPRKAH